MENLMAKKTAKRSHRPAKRAHVQRRHGVVGERMKRVTLRERKLLIADTLEAIVTNAPETDREEIAEHICDVGIELMGHMHGVDPNNAMLIFPDDDIARLIFAIDAHERATGKPGSQIVEHLISQIEGRYN